MKWYDDPVNQGIEIMAVPLHVQITLDYMQTVYPNNTLKIISTLKHDYLITFEPIPQNGFYPVTVFRNDYWRVGAKDDGYDEVFSKPIERGNNFEVQLMTDLFSHLVKWDAWKILEFPYPRLELDLIHRAFFKTSLLKKR
jgi:hypothetical protein